MKKGVGLLGRKHTVLAFLWHCLYLSVCWGSDIR